MKNRYIWSPMCRHIVFLLLALNAVVCCANVPTEAATFDVGAPIVTLRVTPGGTRAVVLVQANDSQSAGVRIIDMDLPHRLVARGFLATEGHSLFLRPDGQLALVLHHIEQPKFNQATRHQIIAVDLSDAHAPKELWRREIAARKVAISDDAKAYAASRPSKAKEGRWETVVTRLDVERADLILEEDQHAPAEMQFSDGATFLVYPQFNNQLRVFDLRSAQPVLYEQSYTFLHRYGCIPAILETGEIVIEDERAPRLGIYAPVPRVPRISTLTHDGMKHCRRLNIGSVPKVLLLGDNLRSIRRVDASDLYKPLFTGKWQLPSGDAAIAASGPFLFSTRGPRELRVSRLDTTTVPNVDWTALAAAHQSALEQYKSETRKGWLIPSHRVIRQMEEAGIALGLDVEVPVQGISARQAAAIFNDFGFWLSKTGLAPSVAEKAMRRAIALDPKRAFAMLNLADHLRQNLLAESDLEAKALRTAQITALYQNYLRLGGKPSRHIAAFLKPMTDSKSSKDVCRTIAEYANAGRLEELAFSQPRNVRVGDRQLDLVFGTQGTAHVPIMYGFDSETDFPIDEDELAAKVPSNSDLWGGDHLALIMFHDTAHLLHYRDYRHPVATSPLGAGPACKFKTRVVQGVGSKATEPKLCQALIKNRGPRPIRFTTPASIPRKLVSERYSETAAGNMRRLTFANDGIAANVVEMQQSSGAGAGCEAEFYDVADDTGQRLLKDHTHQQLMNLQKADAQNRYPMLPCGNKARFFSHHGLVYFENKPEQWPPADMWHQYHRVATIERGRVFDVCDFRFKSTVSVEP